MSLTNLKLFRQFYYSYPEIGQTLSDQLDKLGLTAIGQSLSGQSPNKTTDHAAQIAPEKLLGRLSFSHFIALQVTAIIVWPFLMVIKTPF